MKNMFHVIILSLLTALSATAGDVDGNSILKQVDANLQPASYEMYRKLINIEPDGSRKEFVFYTVKKGKDKMVIMFLSPASEKGRVSLRLGDNMWLYIPNVGKPIRITSLQSVVGGVFNNSDIMRLDFHVEYNVEKVEDLGDRWLLDMKARTRSVAYDRLKMTVDKKTVQPLDIECVASSGMLIKTLRYSDIKDIGDGVVRPAKLVTDSPLHKGYRSVMIFANVKKRQFDDEVFTLKFMPQVDELR
ncbi:outer membrane lipoprotein-sorting protein [Desulfomarina sp.]